MNRVSILLQLRVGNILKLFPDGYVLCRDPHGLNFQLWLAINKFRKQAALKLKFYPLQPQLNGNVEWKQEAAELSQVENKLLRNVFCWPQVFGETCAALSHYKNSP